MKSQRSNPVRPSFRPRGGWGQTSPQIDLGLDILLARRLPGQRFSAREIAAWCGISRQAVDSIANRALGKLARRPSVRLLLSDWLAPT